MSGVEVTDSNAVLTIEDEEWRRGKSRWVYQGGNGANRRRRMGSAASPGRQTSAQFASPAVPLLRSSFSVYIPDILHPAIALAQTPLHPTPMNRQVLFTAKETSIDIITVQLILVFALLLSVAGRLGHLSKYAELTSHFKVQYLIGTTACLLACLFYRELGWALIAAMGVAI